MCRLIRGQSTRERKRSAAYPTLLLPLMPRVRLILLKSTAIALVSAKPSVAESEEKGLSLEQGKTLKLSAIVQKLFDGGAHRATGSSALFRSLIRGRTAFSATRRKWKECLRARRSGREREGDSSPLSPRSPLVLFK